MQDLKKMNRDFLLPAETTVLYFSSCQLCQLRFQIVLQVSSFCLLWYQYFRVLFAQLQCICGSIQMLLHLLTTWQQIFIVCDRSRWLLLFRLLQFIGSHSCSTCNLCFLKMSDCWCPSMLVHCFQVNRDFKNVATACVSVISETFVKDNKANSIGTRSRL